MDYFSYLLFVLFLKVSSQMAKTVYNPTKAGETIMVNV